VRQKQIRRAVDELVSERTAMFKKEESGYYKMVSWKSSRTINTGHVEKLDSTVNEKLYELVIDPNDSYDYVMTIQDENGDDITMKFREVASE
tara:strand:+ start:973 stop:1248 length:276 start_codon:yes stop_codon:yes gene_type:complete